MQCQVNLFKIQKNLTTITAIRLFSIVIPNISKTKK